MSRTLVTGAMVLPIAAGSSEFVYLPEGKNLIFPQSQAAGIEIHVPADRGKAIAAALQADLDKRLTANVEPWFDFEHTRKYPKSGYPKAFRYEKGKGVICSAEWSRSGRVALRGRDVNHFSPEFYVDDDGIPDGLPERGPVGGLVSEPAFRDLPAIAASAADTIPVDPDKAMSKLIFAALAISAAHADAETLAVQEIEKIKSDAKSAKDEATRVKASLTEVEKERDELKTKVTAAETEAKAAKKKAGEELFDRAVAAGLHAPKDDAAKGKFISAAESDNEFALELLKEKVTAAEADGGSDLSRTIVTAGAGEGRQVTGGGAGGEHAFIAESRKLVTAKLAADEETAMEMVASDKPALYQAYRDSL